MRTTTECEYLGGGGPDGLGALRFAALYASWEATRARAVFALHLPMDARCALPTHVAGLQVYKLEPPLELLGQHRGGFLD